MGLERKTSLKEFQEHCRKISEATGIDRSETPVAKKKRIARLLSDYNAFVQYYFPHYTYDADKNKHVDCAEFHIEWANAIAKDKNFFGVAEWAREHAKSVHNNIFIPLWLKAKGEFDGMVLCGKSEPDACALLSDVQAELQSNQRYINDFGLQVRVGSWETGHFVTRDDCFFIALGRGQSPRGIRFRNKRPNYGVADDIDDDELVENLDRVEKTVNWLLGAFYGGLDIRRSRFVMSGNRIHPKSVLAHVVGDIDDNTPKRKGLFHSRVCATMDETFEGKPTWYQKFTTQDLQRKFERMGYYMALREYFHRAVTKGKVFRNEWIQWDRIPPLKDMDWIVGYFDPSYRPKTTNDFKAVRIWGKKGIKLYLITCFVRQSTITAAVKWMYDFYESVRGQCSVEFFMEEVFMQGNFFDDFEAEAHSRGYYIPIHGDRRQKPDKYARILATTAYYERGIVIYNEEQKKSPDMQTGLSQILAFQKGSAVHDDTPDADEGAIYILNTRTRTRDFEPRFGTRTKRDY